MNELERIPPQNIEAEMSLLGSIFLDKDAILKIADLIDEEDFYKNAHRDIYSTMIELYGRNEAVDLLTLSNRLEEKKLLDEKMALSLPYDELQKAAARMGLVLQLIDEKEMRWLQLSERL